MHSYLNIYVCILTPPKGTVTRSLKSLNVSNNEIYPLILAFQTQTFFFRRHGRRQNQDVKQQQPRQLLQQRQPLQQCESGQRRLSGEWLRSRQEEEEEQKEKQLLEAVLLSTELVEILQQYSCSFKPIFLCVIGRMYKMDGMH